MMNATEMLLSNKHHCVGQAIVKQTYGKVITQK